MKKYDDKSKSSEVEEPSLPYMRQFSSQEEAEKFNMIQNIELSDMQKFQLFCRMMRIGKMLASAKIVK